MTVLGITSIKRSLCAATMALFGAGGALACGGIYTVQVDDTLSEIADRLYKDVKVLPILHRDNRAVVGDDPDELRPGSKLKLPCIDGRPIGLELAIDAVNPPPAQVSVPQGTERSEDVGVINLVTAGDFTPFTDRTLAQGGMITEMVSLAIGQAGRTENFRINWINDRTAHLDPLMREGMMDLAFPSYRPDCATLRADPLCQEFLFSDPMFELLTLLFVNKRHPIPFSQDIDIEGKTLCRPEGFSIADLDRADRRWVSEKKITLVQPLAVQDCFAMLAAGDVDGVAINEFTGRAAVRDLGLTEQVEALEGRALAIETLHALVHKSHPRATELLELINSGLADIRETGEYQRVIDRHLPQFWSSL
ncbi:MAG: transporter substrate-binding domain-containing protein [Tateyamaria sp.]